MCIISMILNIITFYKYIMDLFLNIYERPLRKHIITDCLNLKLYYV